MFILYRRGRGTGVNYPKWAKNEFFGGKKEVSSLSFHKRVIIFTKLNNSGVCVRSKRRASCVCVLVYCCFLLPAFGLKLQYWIKASILETEKAEQNKIASFSKLALFLEDCENITFDDIKDKVIKHLTKLRESFSDFFSDLDIPWYILSIGL